MLVSAEEFRMHSTLPHRADIDGLRAVSILLVVGYHAHWIPGGFIGVDVFFVISGFLISHIIITQASNGNFSFVDFYSRRIRRIFPALVAVLIATYLLGWIILLPGDFSLLGKNIAAGVAFVSNLFQLSQLGYFAPDGAENPLLHLWSLGIEEQFYIVWPPILLMIFRSQRRRFWIAAIAATSFAVSLLIFFGYKDWSFYSPLSRAWELLAGGMVADWYIDRAERQRLAARSQDLLATIGLAAILVAALWLKTDSLFPGFYALLPVAGAVLIIVSPESRINSGLLSTRLMVIIGLISYPLYLWHWPLLSYLAIVRDGVPTILEVWLAVILAFILAWLTYRFIELPVRRQNRAVLKLSSALAVVGAVGLLTVAASGYSFRFSPEIREIASLDSYSNIGFQNKCFLEAPGSRFAPDCIEPGSKPLLFLWGDSSAAAFYSGLKNAEAIFPFRLALFAAPGCSPILGNKCEKTNALAFDYLQSSAPEIVLLHAMWDRTDDLEKLRETIGRLKAIHVPRIVILGPVPVWKRTLPQTLVNYYRLRHVIADKIKAGVSGTENDERMENFSKSVGVEYISAWHTLCDSSGCRTQVGPTANDVVTTDIVHLSNSGSNFLANSVGKILFPDTEVNGSKGN
jgi:peptidoglycan/LPS O-acetylase OafA/YrhL